MNENIKKLMEFIDKNRYVNYPIENKELIAGEDYVKNLYLKMLAVMMQQAGQTDEVGTAFFTRIVAGAQTEQTVQDYRRQALEIEVEDFRKFTEVLQENPLKYRFVVDALLLTGIGSQSKEQQQLLVGVMEFLNIGKAEAVYLVQLSRSILMQDNAEYDKAEASRPKTISFELFLEYTRLYAYVLSNDEEYIYISFPQKTEFELTQADLRAKKIYLNNLKIALTEKITLETAEAVIIENCEFSEAGKKDDDYTYISIENNNEVDFIGCSFVDFQEAVIEERGNKAVHFEKCLFENCRKSLYYDDESCGIINSYRKETNMYGNQKPIRIDIKETIFRQCRCSQFNRENYYGRKGSCFVICNEISQVENCSFTDCINRYRYGDNWYDGSARLFCKGSIGTNNDIVNSHNFAWN